jgi:cytidylate kinase
MEKPIVIALDGTSASGKSTNAKRVAKALGYSYVDTGAMYRSLAWYCLKNKVDIEDEKAIASTCRRWKTELINEEGQIRLNIDGYFPAEEIRTAETSALVPVVAAVPAVRKWMKGKQRECIEFGSLVMEGRDIGSNVFPDTDFKFYLDASLDERSKRRVADGLNENLAARDKKDSERATAPLMIPLGAKVINNSNMTAEETSALIIKEVREKLEEV